MPYLEQIHEKLLDFNPDDSVGENTHSDDEDGGPTETTTTTPIVSSTQQRLHRLLKRTRTQFLRYMDQLPIFWFQQRVL